MVFVLSFFSHQYHHFSWNEASQLLDNIFLGMSLRFFKYFVKFSCRGRGFDLAVCSSNWKVLWIWGAKHLRTTGWWISLVFFISACALTISRPFDFVCGWSSFLDFIFERRRLALWLWLRHWLFCFFSRSIFCFLRAGVWLWLLYLRLSVAQGYPSWTFFSFFFMLQYFT